MLRAGYVQCLEVSKGAEVTNSKRFAAAFISSPPPRRCYPARSRVRVTAARQVPPLELRRPELEADDQGKFLPHSASRHVEGGSQGAGGTLNPKQIECLRHKTRR